MYLLGHFYFFKLLDILSDNPHTYLRIRNALSTQCNEKKILWREGFQGRSRLACVPSPVGRPLRLFGVLLYRSTIALAESRGEGVSLCVTRFLSVWCMVRIANADC